VENLNHQEYYYRLYNHILSRSKRVPVDRALSFDMFKNMLYTASEKIIDIDEKVRKDMGAIENTGFYFVPDEATEEEAAAIIEDVKNRKSEAAKKLKQKPKTEEEEAAEAE